MNLCEKSDFSVVTSVSAVSKVKPFHFGSFVLSGSHLSLINDVYIYDSSPVNRCQLLTWSLKSQTFSFPNLSLLLIYFLALQIQFDMENISM